MTAPPPSTVLILDTDVFSYFRKNSPEAAPYLPHLVGVTPAITMITVAELYAWAYQRNWSPRNLAALEERFTQFLILPFDLAVAQQWAKIQTAIPGRRFPDNDAWVAACALSFGCSVMTHNRKDFQDVPGLTIISYAPEL